MGEPLALHGESLAAAHPGEIGNPRKGVTLPQDAQAARIMAALPRGLALSSPDSRR
jgi:hypothetical protein